MIKQNNIHNLASIDKYSVIKNSTIEQGAKVEQSYIENSIIKQNATIGPFAHIRPNCVIGENCKIGNFCEIKNSIIGDGTKVSHLAYVGDAIVGKNCNIGCGVIFANYNGKEKNKIEIGDNVFIGSNCNLIAPLKIASNVYVCAGTTVTQDLANDDFVIGRLKECIKPNRAHNYFKNIKKD